MKRACTVHDNMIIEQTNELREMCLLHTLVYVNLIWVRIPWHQTAAPL